VTYNGIDLAHYHPDGPHTRPTGYLRLLLVEGRLGDGGEVGLENAVQLTELLQQSHHLPVRLMVVGKTPPELHRQYQERAGGSIEWQGVVPRGEIAVIDRSAHLFFSADLNAACPNSVIEALACGLPVAALDTGALREMVWGDAGRVVPYGSNHWKLEPPCLPPLAQAAAEILAANERFRQAARAHAEVMFGLDAMVEGYLAALTGAG
jgi:glycosyltransferase involved in cell wall biosynthesis